MKNSDETHDGNSNYYFIANNGCISSDARYKEKLIDEIKPNDVVVQFNNTINFDFIKKLNCIHYLVLNKNGSTNIHGLKEYKVNRLHYDKVYVQNDVFKFVKKDLVVDDKLFVFPISDYKFKTDKIPSVGYKFYRYLVDVQQIPIKCIKLVGFTFSGWPGHDWVFEKKECELLNIL